MLSTDISSDVEEAHKKPVLPSELRRILRDKKTKTRVAMASSLSKPALPINNDLKIKIPLEKRHRGDIIQKVVNSTETTISKPKIKWTILTRFNLTCGPHIANWSKLDPSSQTSKLTFFESLLENYRFPHPHLPPDAHLKIKLLLNGKDSFEKAHWQEIVKSWRRALVSLYNNFKHHKIEYFYYLQYELVVLFRWKDKVTEAIIAKASPELMRKLKAEGIVIVQETEQKVEKEELSPSHNEEPYNETTDEASSQEDSSVRREHIRSIINNRLNRARRVGSAKLSAAATTISISGESNVHSLVDYLLNQRDGKSYVVLPELVAPGPFLFGTLCRTDISLIGPMGGEQYQVRLVGLILPHAAQSILDAVISETDARPGISVGSDLRTEPFISLSLQ